MSKPHLEAVLWDMDGVIADTMQYHMSAWQDILKDMGIPMTEADFRPLFGQRHDRIIRHFLGDKMTHEEIEALSDKKQALYRARVAKDIRALPGAIDLMKALQKNGIKSALASSATKENVDIIVNGLGITKLFQAFVNGPEVAEGKGVSQPEQFHAYDVFEHSLRAVEAVDAMLATHASVGGWLNEDMWRHFEWRMAELTRYLDHEMSESRSRGALLKLAALLHDAGKPRTRSVEADGRVRFLGHADVGAGMARQIMRRLRFSAREVVFVEILVGEHLRPVQLAQVGEAPTRRALYRFYRDLGDAMPAVLFLALADAAAARGPAMTREGWSRQVAYMNGLLVRSMEEEGIVHPPRLVSGQDIMLVLGIPEGPTVGRLLEALEEAQAAGEVHDKEQALAFIRGLAREGPAGR